MLSKPQSCSGCPLVAVGMGFMAPSLGGNRVTLLGEALGRDEAAEGMPFVGKAGHRLTRLIEWAGFSRGDFDIYNAAWCQPPGNKLEGEWYERQSVDHCRRHHWGHLLARSGVVVTMGNVPTGALLGFKGVLTARGYVYPGPPGIHVIPTVHPSFIARGQAKWSAAFINDIRKAVTLAQHGLPPQFTDYLLDPLPGAAYLWARDYRAALDANPGLRLAFDIETPGKGDEDEIDASSDAPDKSWKIERIGFSYRGLSGMSIPWAPEYIAVIRLLMESEGEKVVWNAGFDVPRIRRAGVGVSGLVHDGMVAWHILHSDQPKSLRFVATFTCPWQPAWKHLSGSRPAFYNCTDADVEWRSMDVLERELRQGGLWEVYARDVLELEPILVHMQRAGMPVDQDVRLANAIRLATDLDATDEELTSHIPLAARKIAHVYINTPASTEGLYGRPSTKLVPTCTGCGLVKPPKAHFKAFKRKSNPCASHRPEPVEVPVVEYYRLAPFTPSRDQLSRYHQHLGRRLPTVFDKRTSTRKVSFGAEQIMDLALKYPTDPVYNLILRYRELDKLAGTYVGRPACSEESTMAT